MALGLAPISCDHLPHKFRGLCSLVLDAGHSGSGWMHALHTHHAPNPCRDLHASTTMLPPMWGDLTPDKIYIISKEAWYFYNRKNPKIFLFFPISMATQSRHLQFQGSWGHWTRKCHLFTFLELLVLGCSIYNPVTIINRMLPPIFSSFYNYSPQEKWFLVQPTKCAFSIFVSYKNWLLFFPSVIYTLPDYLKPEPLGW